MGERGVATIKGTNTGVYLHWDGDITTVEAIATFCRLRRYRCADDPDYGIARFAFVAGCLTGAEEGLSVGVGEAASLDSSDWGRYTFDRDWRIVEWTADDDVRDDHGMYDGREWTSAHHIGRELRRVNESVPLAARIDSDVLEGYIDGILDLESARKLISDRYRQMQLIRYRELFEPKGQDAQDNI